MLVVRRCWLWALPAICLLLSGCPEGEPRKPDPTKGTVTGVVICADTGKPARFAEVQLLPAAAFNVSSESSKNEVDISETSVTALDGRFTIEAVPPGEYYAYATMEGYLDPELGVDAGNLGPKADESAQFLDSLNQWKEHLVRLTVSVQHTTELPITIERGAEIEGTVSYEDSSPAIGMRFQFLRKTRQGHWAALGNTGNGGWSTEKTSDSHGRYRITNLDRKSVV